MKEGCPELQRQQGTLIDHNQAMHQAVHRGKEAYGNTHSLMFSSISRYNLEPTGSKTRSREMYPRYL